MSGQDSDETTGEQQDSQIRGEQDTRDENHHHSDADVELSDEGRQEVHEMVEAYKDKPTIALPGTHGTITGTAINEWVDEQGNPKFGDADEHPYVEEPDESEGGGSNETSDDGS